MFQELANATELNILTVAGKASSPIILNFIFSGNKKY